MGAPHDPRLPRSSRIAYRKCEISDCIGGFGPQPDKNILEDAPCGVSPLMDLFPQSGDKASSIRSLLCKLLNRMAILFHKAADAASDVDGACVSYKTIFEAGVVISRDKGELLSCDL